MAYDKKDITHAILEARLKGLEVERQHLLNLLPKAEKVKEKPAVEKPKRQPKAPSKGRTLKLRKSVPEELKMDCAGEIKKAMEIYDFADGFPTSAQVVDFIADYHNITMHQGVKNNLYISIAALVKNKKVGRVRNNRVGRYVYAPMEYFLDNGKVKPEFKNLAD